MDLNKNNPTPSTGDDKIDLMVQATIKFTEQLVIMSSLLTEISKSTSFIENYIKQTDGLSAKLQHAQESIDSNIKQIKDSTAEIIEQSKLDTDKKIDSAAKSIVLKVSALFASSTAIFAFIVYIIDKIYSTKLNELIQHLDKIIPK